VLKKTCCGLIVEYSIHHPYASPPIFHFHPCVGIPDFRYTWAQGANAMQFMHKASNLREGYAFYAGPAASSQVASAEGTGHSLFGASTLCWMAACQCGGEVLPPPPQLLAPETTLERKLITAATCIHALRRATCVHGGHLCPRAR